MASYRFGFSRHIGRNTEYACGVKEFDPSISIIVRYRPWEIPR